MSVISILICLGDYLGSGLANIILVRFNPVLDAIKFTEPFRNWMIDTEDTKWAADSALISLRFPAYLIHFGTFLVTGFVIDFFIYLFRRKPFIS